MPETQNFDPVSFDGVHDNYRTFDEGAKVGSFANTMSRFWKCTQHLDPATKACDESLCGHAAIFRDKIADFDKVRFCPSG
jgi:hypothetical protein